MRDSRGRGPRIVKTCMVVYSYYPFDPRVRREARALVAKGYDVDIICLRDKGEREFEVVDHANVYRLSLIATKGGYSRYLYQYAMYFLMAFVLLTKLFFKKRYDVIHIHTLPDFQVFISVIPKIFGCKVILDLHEAMPEIFAARFNLSMNSGRVKLATFLERISCIFANRLMTINDVLKERLTRRIPYRDKITVVMNSPDETLNANRDVGEFVMEHRLSNRFIIVFVGGINKERNLEVLLEAAVLLKKELSPYLIIFGYGKEEYENELKALAKNLGLEKDVYFGSWIPHEYVPSYMNLSTLGIVSYMNNPLTQVAVPNKVFEFASLGKPLIIAKLKALENLFRGAALFYEPENAKELASSISRLNRDKNLANTLIKEAKKVYEKCKWDVMKERLYEVYEDLVGRKV